MSHQSSLLVVPLAVLLLAACSGDWPILKRLERMRGGDDSAAACFARLDRIKGLKYQRLPELKDGACGYDNGIMLLDVGVPITGLKAVSCPAAEQLFHWLHDGVRPAARNHFGSDVVRLQSFGSYACRSRNGQDGARLSEHAHANAIDIAAFTLANGRTIRVASGWRATGRRDAAKEQSFLRAVHRAGCSRFDTVIGPDADRFHQDHIHLDMGKASYCR